MSFLLPAQIARKRGQQGDFHSARSPMQAHSTPNPSPVKRAASPSFRQRCAFVADAPCDAWSARRAAGKRPGIQGALAGSMGARETERPRVDGVRAAGAGVRPVVRDVRKRLKAQRAAFVAAYAGLPLLYAAFNTFSPVHDVVLHVLGFIGGDGPRSPWDPTDSIVIPVAMAAAIWVWRRPSLDARSLRTRLALLAAAAAALASVATSYGADRGVDNVGRTAPGKLGTNILGGFYQSTDGGFTWTKTNIHPTPLEKLQLMELGEIEPEGIFSGGRIRITNNAVLSSGKVVYSFEYLQSGGNRWMQALDKQDIRNRVIATVPGDFFYDSQSGNLILAMGLQGVVVVAPDGNDNARSLSAAIRQPTSHSASKTYARFRVL